MAYAKRNGKVGYRSSSWDEVQGYADLLTLWVSLRDIAKGKRKPLSQDVMDRVVKGLKRTVNESSAARTRIVASAIVMAIAEEDWERDVFRAGGKRG